MQHEQAMIAELLSAGYSMRAIAHNCGVTVATMDRISSGKAKAVRPGTRLLLKRLVEGQRVGASAYELPALMSTSAVARVVRELMQTELDPTGLLYFRA